MRQVKSVRRVPVVLAAVVAAVWGVAATPALGASPWWQLDSVAAPANMDAGLAKSEVQEIAVEGIEVEPGLNVAAFELKVKGTSVGYFITEPLAAAFGLTAPTAKNVQTALEKPEAYGPGNVQVVGSEAGTAPVSLTVDSVGERASSKVEPVEVSFECECAGSGGAKVTTPGRSDGYLDVTASNLGAGEIDGSRTPVVLRDRLPAGLVAKTVQGRAGGTEGALLPAPMACAVVSASLVQCEFAGKLAPYEELQAEIAVDVAGTQPGQSNEVTVSGGGARPVSLQRPVTFDSAPTPFGAANYELSAFNEDGSLDTQAGSHPYQVTTTLDLNQTGEKPFLPAQAKDLRFKLPPGLLGNPTPFPQCSDARFASQLGPGGTNQCPADTALGVAAITIYEPIAFPPSTNPEGLGTVTSPIFNLTPSPGEPAKFGFQTITARVILDTSVRTGGDYGVTVSSNNIVQAASFISSRVTFWGVPGASVHDGSRGTGCLDGEGACQTQEQTAPPPFLILPTSCTGPLQTTFQADSWAQKGVFTEPLSPLFEPALDGCNRLPFEPSMSVAPDSQSASTPSGLTVGIHVPQDLILNPTGLAESTVKDTTVALPAGVALNPAAADGLVSCSEAQIALSADVAASCPEAAKVGSVEIKTPLLPNPLTGWVYLAAQTQNPFGSLVALYIVAEDPISGTLIKLAGEVKPDPVTGQLVSTFKNTPQLPFEDLSLHFFGGSRAPLATPSACGSYTTTSSIAPWSGNPPAEPSSTFQIDSGANGSPCQNPLPFNPELTAGSTNIQAGAFTPFTTTMSRSDGQQSLRDIVLHMPPGLSGLLTGVKLCGEAEGNMGTCGPDSEIGETIVSVGVGGTPFSVKGGRVYITGPYKGAPFGLSIVNPAKAGPYDLEQGTPCDCVVVRAKIEVDPITAALTITTDNTGPYEIPTILDGIPLQIQHVNVTITRPGFTFNPTNCNPMSITGSLSSTEGATSALSVPLQVTNCAVLGFKPQFSVSTSGKTSRAKGASLHVKLAYPKAAFGSQANIRSVKVDLPRQLPSRLTTLQKACPDSTFNQNPALCPAASKIGTAKAITPLVPVPLEGPVYFVSHGGAKFPELIIVLQGYGVTLDLHSETFINKAGITSSTFHTIPDAPVGTFELTLPEGANSALAANGNLCSATRTVLVKKRVKVRSKGRTRFVTRKVRKAVSAGLVMPTAFNAQNGAVIHQNTPIEVTGCSKHTLKGASKTKPKHKHNKKKGKKKK